MSQCSYLELSSKTDEAAINTAIEDCNGGQVDIFSLCRPFTGYLPSMRNKYASPTMNSGWLTEA